MFSENSQIYVIIKPFNLDNISIIGLGIKESTANRNRYFMWTWHPGEENDPKLKRIGAGANIAPRTNSGYTDKQMNATAAAAAPLNPLIKLYYEKLRQTIILKKHVHFESIYLYFCA